MKFEELAQLGVEELIELPSFRDWALGKTSQDTDQWEALLQVHPHKKEDITTAKNLVISMQDFFDEGAVDQAFVKSSFEELLVKREGQIIRASKTKRIAWTGAIAASVMIFFAMYLFVLPLHEQSDTQVFTTGFGKTKELILPDGSQVILNANSSLTYHIKDWRTSMTRKVWLEGEAYFMVEKKEVTKEKFQVITQDVTVEVLGTAFNVHNRTASTKVFLDEGKVSLQLDNESEKELEMTPGDLVVYSKKESKVIERRKADGHVQTSWKEGALVFNETPLREVLAELEAIYGVKFEVEEPALYDRTLTTGLPTTDINIAKLALSKALNLELISTNNDIIFLRSYGK